MLASKSPLGVTSRCHICQSQILNAFISSFQSPVNARLVWPLSRSLTLGPSHSRNVETTQEEPCPDEAFVPDKPQESVGLEFRNPQSGHEKLVPWYLKTQQNVSEPSSFDQRQSLPKLPHNSPPLLQPLLQHLSIDIGLDYLSLFDLRKLDPPPALGSNLLMIIGTARSKKHLNVSADRLCRWLRTHHKLSPVADGLLGRNELKLKLKRKARRNRILSAAGGSDLTPMDDGITTGWICINVGAVEDGRLELNGDSNPHSGFVGFGNCSRTVKVVVQVMTEETRSDLDLESLWQGVLDRAHRKEMQDEDWPGGQGHPSERNKRHSNRPMTNTKESYTLSQRPLHSTIAQQTRDIHTSRPISSASNVQTTEETNPVHVEDSEADQQSNKTAFNLSDATTAWAPQQPSENYENIVFETPMFSDQEIRSGIALGYHLDLLSRFSPKTALRALGSSYDDNSSPFLASFHANIPPFPSLAHWDTIIRLHVVALSLNHPEYGKSGLVSILRRMEESSSSMPASIFISVIDILLNAPHSFDETTTERRSITTLPGKHSFRRSLSLAFEVLEMMEDHGHSVLEEEILLSLHNAVSHPRFHEQLVHEDRGKIVRSNQYRLRQALAVLFPHTHSAALDLAMLRTYAKQSNWDAFWDIWNEIPLSMRSRSSEMYQVLFDEVANSGSQNHARRVLEYRFPEMNVEDPPISLVTDTAVAVYKCVLAAGYENYNAHWRDVSRACKAEAQKLIETRKAEQ